MEGTERAVQPASEAFLQLLERALRQLRTYAPSHAVCVEAIAACQKALVARPGPDDLQVRVTADGLQVGEQPVGAMAVDQLLLTRLQRARVAELTVSREASARDLAMFGLELLGALESGPVLADRLTEHGITAIGVRLVPRPELLEVPAPSPAHRDLLERERRRREEKLTAAPRALHLYPADKGWVRLDPAVDYRACSLTDLSILVESPAELAGMLARLGEEDEGADAEGRSALERRFQDVARLFASLDSRLGRVMFAKLARAVLDMDSAQRQRLLRETVLTGLLDGEAGSAILNDFPDPTLAESLCLLLDLENAAPEVVTTALDRLGLSPERRSALELLINTQVQGRQTGTGPGPAGLEADQYARRLTQVESAPGKSFSEFAAFDLSLDAQTSAALAEVQQAIDATDPVAARLECLVWLVRIEPNPEEVRVFMAAAVGKLAELQGDARWTELAGYLGRLRELGLGLRERRPEVAEVIAGGLLQAATPELARVLLARYDVQTAESSAAIAVVDALSDALGPAFASLLDEGLAPRALEALTALMSHRATEYAPALAARLGQPGTPASTVSIVRILGHAGAGQEATIAAQLAGDESVRREALRALARIGTAAAARYAVAELTARPDTARAAALQALLHFPPAVVRVYRREVLARMDLACRYPALLGTLLDRVARGSPEGMEDVLGSLARLRFRFWNPGAARLGRRARALLGP